jgi:hypothetical protein
VAEKFGYDYKGDVPLYGCEHFDAPVRNFLGRVVQSDQYINALDLRRDLEDCAVKLGWSFEHKEADPRAAQALAHKRKALLYLREAQRAMIEAIDEIDQSHALQGGMDTDHLVEQVEKLYKSSFLP